MSAMTITDTMYAHIQRDHNGVPFIEGTTMRVVELVMSQIAHGWSPEELHFQYPYLSMSQIHSALAYYWEHRPELDADIQRRLEYADQMREEAESTPSPLKTRLKKEGFIA